MNFAQQQSPQGKLIGITAVLLFHGLLAYALLTGLATKVVEVIRAPIETKVIEERVKPPPPPEVAVPPPPKLEVPPPPFIPPPEVVIAAPPPVQPTITATTPTPPPAPVQIAPAPPVVAAPAPAPAPAPPPVAKPAGPVAAGTVCTKMPPPEAPSVNFEAQGSIFVVGTLKAGRVVQVDIERNTLKGVPDRRAMRRFTDAVESVLKEGYQCSGDGVQFRQEFYFDIK